MSQRLLLHNFGFGGVNVDSEPMSVTDDQLRTAQNVEDNPLGVAGGLSKRAGLTPINSTAGAGSILGGIVVLLDNPLGGSSIFLCGREEQ